MIVRKTLHDELFPLLCNMIVEGELDAGCKVPCARFGASRPPLREVLNMLSVKGRAIAGKSSCRQARFHKL
jgi:DNA-binding FadR family transcriptional regulator